MATVGAPVFVYSSVRDSDSPVSLITVLNHLSPEPAIISYRQLLQLSLLRPLAFSFRLARGRALL